MTDDLVTRLRAEGGHATCACVGCEARRDAADEIERLRARDAEWSEVYQADLGMPMPHLAILDVCDGLDADTVEAALFIAQEVRSFQPLLLADWKPRSER